MPPLRPQIARFWAIEFAIATILTRSLVNHLKMQKAG